MKKKKKNTAKNLNKGLIAFLVMAVVALNFSLIGNVLADDLEESNQNLALSLPVKADFNEPAPITPLMELTTPEALAICDHTGEGLRNLSDVSEFAECKDTFDADGNGIHDLNDISIYASMNQDNAFCNTTFKCVAEPIVSPVTENQGLPICDHTGEGLRNLSDVSEFAECKDTFDADGNGIHDLNDISIYASMNQDNAFCRDTFKCIATSTPAVIESIGETSVRSNNGGSSSNSVGLNICDHNGDTFRNLSDVALFAEIKDTLNLSQIADYAEHNQDDTWCAANYGAKKVETTAKVLGEKLSNCKIDTDVAGQTEWAEGSLIRGCDMKVYHIENQAKRHIVNLKDLFKYIGQRIYNVSDDIVALF
jgi:hypothetical protein